MAYIIGLVTEEEKKELERRAWDIDEPPKHFRDMYDVAAQQLEGKTGTHYIGIMIYVDTNLFEIMNGPDWEKG